MPELPEVETIRRMLLSILPGKVIEDVYIFRPDIVGFPSVKGFFLGVRGKKVQSLLRRGKYLIFKLNQEKRLVIHLRLSGHLRVIDKEGCLKYERVRFCLNNCKALSFVDPRALGRIYLIKEGSFPRVLKGLKELGLEPIEEGFTPEYLSQKLLGRKAKLKSLLMDQRICAGVGNIYSDEALFFAGIRPTRSANTLTKDDIGRLTRALKEVLEEGIKWAGTTMIDERYQLPDGERGRFQDCLMVVGRAGLPCKVCGSEIKRIKMGNRSSYFCPKCQK